MEYFSCRSYSFIFCAEGKSKGTEKILKYLTKLKALLHDLSFNFKLYSYIYIQYLPFEEDIANDESFSQKKIKTIPSFLI